MRIQTKEPADVSCRIYWQEKKPDGSILQKSFATSRKKAQQMLPEMRNNPFLLNVRFEGQ